MFLWRWNACIGLLGNGTGQTESPYEDIYSPGDFGTRTYMQTENTVITKQICCLGRRIRAQAFFVWKLKTNIHKSSHRKLNLKR